MQKYVFYENYWIEIIHFYPRTQLSDRKGVLYVKCGFDNVIVDCTFLGRVKFLYNLVLILFILSFF